MHLVRVGHSCQVNPGCLSDWESGVEEGGAGLDANLTHILADFAHLLAKQDLAPPRLTSF